jgi:hypothetical protein
MSTDARKLVTLVAKRRDKSDVSWNCDEKDDRYVERGNVVVLVRIGDGEVREYLVPPHLHIREFRDA